jgi:hypothetical protein
MWLHDRLQAAIKERMAATLAKNKRSEKSTLVSCFPAVDTSKKSIMAVEKENGKLAISYGLEPKEEQQQQQQQQ